MQRNSRIKIALILLISSIGYTVQAASLQEARSLYHAGKLTAALEQTNSLLESRPDNVPALFLRAQIYSVNQRITAAIDTYKKLLLLSPGHLQAYNNLAALYAQQGQLEMAAETLEKAIRTDPVFTTIHTNLRAIYMDMSQKHYRQALKLKTEDSPTQIAAIDINEGVDQILNQEIEVVPQSIQDAINTSVVTSPVHSSKKPAEAARPTVPQKAPAKKAVAAKPAEAPEVVKKPAKAAATKPVTEVTTAPVQAEPKPAVAKPQKADPAHEVKKALLAWANAWSNRDAKKYVSAYLNDYATPGKTNKDWAAGRRWNFKNKKYIKVALSDIRIRAVGDQYRANFTQKYESDTYRDVVSKELVFVQQAGRWKIAEEGTS